jgi:hypothetical protein
VDRLAQVGGLAATVRAEVVDARVVNAFTLPGRRMLTQADSSSEAPMDDDAWEAVRAICRVD